MGSTMQPDATIRVSSYISLTSKTSHEVLLMEENPKQPPGMYKTL